MSSSFYFMPTDNSNQSSFPQNFPQDFPQDPESAFLDDMLLSNSMSSPSQAYNYDPKLGSNFPDMQHSFYTHRSDPMNYGYYQGNNMTQETTEVPCSDSITDETAEFFNGLPNSVDTNLFDIGSPMIKDDSDTTCPPMIESDPTLSEPAINVSESIPTAISPPFLRARPAKSMKEPEDFDDSEDLESMSSVSSPKQHTATPTKRKGTRKSNKCDTLRQVAMAAAANAAKASKKRKLDNSGLLTAEEIENLDPEECARLEKNRLSARNCRLRKKQYILGLEAKVEELERELEESRLRESRLQAEVERLRARR